MSDERELKNQIPCIVDEGIVANRRDMVRILRDLGHVRYQDMLDGRLRTEGEGFVTSVFSNQNGATIFVNKRLYINVNSFDYLRLGKTEDDGAAIDLVDEARTVRLLPLSDPLLDRQGLVVEPALVQSAGGFGRIFEDGLAEVYLDEDADEPDET
jgi:hypothetical protein